MTSEEAVALAREITDEGWVESSNARTFALDLARAVIEQHDEIERLQREASVADSWLTDHNDTVRAERDRLRAALKDALGLADYNGCVIDGSKQRHINDRIAALRKEFGL